MKRRSIERTKNRPDRAGTPPAPGQQAAPAVPGELGWWTTLGAAMLTLVLSLPLFAPWSWWPVAWVAFVPWLIAITRARRAWQAYLASYALGAAFFLFHFRWLWDTTPEGFVAASLLYLAPFFPLGAWGMRHPARRRHLPLAIVFPVIWTAIEIVRAHNPLAFPWFFLGHTQIRLLPMVQIADATGVYGVSFVVAAINGLAADAILRSWPRREDRWAALRPVLRIELPIVAGLLLATLGYGIFRMRQSDYADGPLIAVVQGDFLLRAVINDPHGATDIEKQLYYFDMMNKAVAARPDVDLVVFPETPWAMFLNPAMREYAQPMRMHLRILHHVETTGKPLVIGAMSIDPQPEGSYPQEHRYNSAYLYTPGGGEPQRYDKIHLVPFGEYVPFRYSKHLFWLYRFLNDGPWNPWGRPAAPGEEPFEYSLTPGREYTVLKLPPSASNANGRFGVTICYEDVIPQIFRRFVADADGTKRVDFMLNISNDGWFGHGTQQPQHLVNCAFRAIENRVGVARAVNTGVSGFIAPDGRWYDLMVEPGRAPHAGGKGYRTASVKLDERVSFYSMHGDVFGFVCLVPALLAVGDGVVYRARQRRAARAKAINPQRATQAASRQGKGGTS